MIHRFVDLFEKRGIGFPCLGVHNHDGFNFAYVALLPYDGSGVPDNDTAEVSTEEASFAFTPMMDPHSRRIVWKQAGELRIIGEDGSGEATIKDATDGAIYSPWWHPNGPKILFMQALSDGVGTPDVVSTIEPDGSNETVLYTAPSNTAFLRPASYNCDGTRIAFAQKITSTTRQLKTMDADGSNVLDIAVIAGASDRADSPTWSWFTDDPDRLIANVGTTAAPVIKAMDYDGTSLVTLDSGTTRTLPGHFAVMRGDTHYVTLASTKIVLVALDGSGATDLLTPAKAPNHNVFSDGAPCANGRLYFETTNFPSANDIRSCLPDGSGERNETAATSRAYGLTG